MFSDWPVLLSDTTIADNSALQGGGLYVDASAASMSGGAMVRNVAPDGGGGV